MSLAGQLATDARAALEAHLSVCPACAGVCRGNAAMGRALGLAAPEPLQSRRDLASEALRQAAASPRRRRRLVVSGLGAVLAAAILAWALLGPPASQRLLAMVQAATLSTPTHDVTCVYDARGRLLQRAESRHAPTGDVYSELDDSRGRRRTMLSRREENVIWLWHQSTSDYELVWGAAAEKSREEQARSAVAGIGLPSEAWGQFRELVGGLLSAGEDTRVTRRTGKLEGRKTRIVQIETSLASPTGADGRRQSPRKLQIQCTLSADGSRLRRLLVQTPTATVDVWPIEYDVQPDPASFELRLPPDARVLFRGDRVDPVWERMAPAQRRAVRELVQRLGKAWAAGDFEAFSRDYDYSAALRYGVKSKFTAEQIRDSWRGMLRRQQGRWRAEELVFDYAVGTSRPPSAAMEFFSIYSAMGSSTEGWHRYGDTPGSEPGLLVLGRQRVTDKAGKTRELGTMLFARRIDGRYKVILWRPPFA